MKVQKAKMVKNGKMDLMPGMLNLFKDLYEMDLFSQLVGGGHRGASPKWKEMKAQKAKGHETQRWKNKKNHVPKGQYKRKWKLKRPKLQKWKEMNAQKAKMKGKELPVLGA